MATNRAYAAATTARFGRREHTHAQAHQNDDGQAQGPHRFAQGLEHFRAGWRGGWRHFSRRTSHHQVMAERDAQRRPGTMPARNSLLMDTLAATQKSRNRSTGGMTGAMMPAEAISPAERALSCPATTLVGSGGDAGPLHRPPRTRRRRPDHRRHDRRIAQAAGHMAHHGQRQLDDVAGRPPHVHDFAASMKNGTASSGRGSAPLMTFCARNLRVEQIEVQHQRNAAKGRRRRWECQSPWRSATGSGDGHQHRANSGGWESAGATDRQRPSRLARWVDRLWPRRGGAEMRATSPRLRLLRCHFLALSP